MLERIARFCVRRRGLVLIAWIGILLVTNVVGQRHRSAPTTAPT